MAPKVLLTGITGYIGGDALHVLFQKHPDWEYTALVRNSDKGAKVAADFPKVRLVYGDLDSTQLIEEESAKADIVYHFANADHAASANAIIKGLAKHGSTSFLIHTSGSGVLTAETAQKEAFGDELKKVYNDWDGIKELTSLPDEAAHRDVDKIILAAGSDSLKVAIVCPPTIYGEGRGPDNTRSIQVPKATEGMLKEKRGFVIGKGKNVWHQIHVHDLSDLYLLLGEAAANGGPPATWNDQGYYLAENGSFVWGDVLQAVTKELHKRGFVSSPEAENASVEDAQKFFPKSHYYVGTNSRGESLRGKKLLGWKPHRESLVDNVPHIVDVEAKRLGLVTGHAAKVEQ